MSSSQKPERGIRDWEEKLSALKNHFQVRTFKRLFEVLLGLDDFDVTTQEGRKIQGKAADLASRFRKWKRGVGFSDPSDFDLFVKMYNKLGITNRFDYRSFADMSLADFCKLWQRSEEVPGQPATANAREPNSKSSIFLHIDGAVDTMAAGVKQGYLDTRHYYSSADGAESWRNVVNSESYPTYQHCKSSLKRLVESDVWKSAVSEARPTVAVLLGGGGAPSKDLVLGRALANNVRASQEKVTMCLVDVNPHMLRQSDEFLRSSRVKELQDGTIEIHLHQKDMLQLRADDSCFTRRGCTLFACLGGTIGNVSENAFFRSLEKVCRSGDLLILSADTVPEGADDEWRANLIGKYDDTAVVNFVRPGVIAALSDAPGYETIEQATKRIKVKVTPNTEKKLSDIAGALSITMELSVNGRDIILLRSTRYTEKELVAFSQGFRWELLSVTPNLQNPSFRQFFFRRK